MSADVAHIADDEQAGRARANSLPASSTYGWTQLSDQRVAEGVERTQGRLNNAATGEQRFSAARDNQIYRNEQARRIRGGRQS